MKRYVSPAKEKRIRFCRENVFLRDRFTCQYCMSLFDKKELTLDHVLPASKGGRKSWENVVTACRKCNQKKGNRTPDQARMPLPRKAAQPTWLPVREIRVAAEASPSTWLDYLLRQKLTAGTG